MSNIKIQESAIDLKNGRKGRIAILICIGEEDPIAALDSAVSTYVGNAGYNEFIDINMDNPNVRVIMSDVNDMKQNDFDSSRDRLQA